MLSIFNRFQKIRFRILVLDTGIAWHAAPYAAVSGLRPKTVSFRIQGMNMVQWLIQNFKRVRLSRI